MFDSHTGQAQSGIFVQIASYRDPQLIPTLIDLIERSANPYALRAVVCWQHAPSETIDEFLANGFTRCDSPPRNDYAILPLSFRDATVELIDVPYLESRGTCWARNLIQQRYANEKYTLQLDSHHRFVENWDRLLVDMLESLREASSKPVLTAYLPAFDPNDDPNSRVHLPTFMVFDRFSLEGAALFRSFYFGDLEPPVRPRPARFYSGHFAFADGRFAAEVQHDPSFFFEGEEISLSVRAFTHGYDFYHPHRVVAWHQYTRDGRAKNWDDHTAEAKARGDVSQHWGERNDASHHRNRCLLGMESAPHGAVDFGAYGLGNVRTPAQYERYAGVSFAHRAVHAAALEGRPPAWDESQSMPQSDWLSGLLRQHSKRVRAHVSLPAESSIAHSCRLRVLDNDGGALEDIMLDEAKLRERFRSSVYDHPLTFSAPFDQAPACYVLELFDSGGESLARIEEKIEEQR